MTPSYEVDYLLPVTAARFDITTMTTTVAGSDPATETTADVSVVTEGDTRYPQCARITTGWINDVDATLSLLPELRLSGVTAESTGRLGEVVAAGVKLAASVAAARITGGAGLTAAAAGGAGAFTHEAAVATEPEATAPDTADIDARIAGLRDHIKSETDEIFAIAEGAIGQANLRVPLRKIALLKTLRAAEEAELSRAVKARESLIALVTTTRRSTGVRTLTFDVLPDPSVINQEQVDCSLDIGSLNNVDVLGLWNECGVVLTATAVPGQAPLNGTPATGVGAVAAGVVHRVPYKVQWALWRSAGQDDNGSWDATVTPVSQGISWVVSSRSATRFVKFRRSWWAKRKVAIDFSADGTAAKLSVGATSSAAAVATALGGAPQAYSDALTTAKTIVETQAELADHAEKDRLADLTRAYDLREKQLKDAALTATAGEYAELERLKQQVALAEQRAKLAPATASPTAIAQAELERYLVESMNSRRDELSAGSVESVAATLNALRD